MYARDESEIMKQKETTPSVPSAGEGGSVKAGGQPTKPSGSIEAGAQPTEPSEPKAVDPKEAARQRSKADLERKRQSGRKSHGKR